jgi:hypothetical protein
MILRRYGTSMHSVDLNFDAKAMTEIGFRRDQRLSIPIEEFQRSYQKGQAHDLTAQTEGYVQDAAERGVLQQLEKHLRELDANLSDGSLLVIESEQGVDYPKTRTDQKTIVEGGENKLFFTVRVQPPLRVAVYRKNG